MIEIKKENKTIETKEYYCDLCKNKIWGFNELSYNDEDNFNYGSDGGFQRKYIYDVCDKCMKNIIFKYIKSKTKEEPRVEERSW